MRKQQCYFQAKLYYKTVYIWGSGCGSVGKAVASDIRGPQFESSHWHKFILILNICLLSTVHWKDENKEKEAGYGPFFKKLFISFRMVNSCCISLGVNLDLRDFLQKKSFLTSTTAQQQQLGWCFWPLERNEIKIRRISGKRRTLPQVKIERGKPCIFYVHFFIFEINKNNNNSSNNKKKMMIKNSGQKKAKDCNRNITININWSRAGALV